MPSSFAFNASCGYFQVSTAVQSEVTGAAIKEILDELNRIRKGIKKSEIDFAKSFLIKRYPSLFETNSQITKNLMTMIIHSLPGNYFNTYIEKINSCSLEEVEEAAQNNIRPEDLIILVAGNKKTIEPQIAELSNNNYFELDYLGKEIT